MEQKKKDYSKHTRKYWRVQIKRRGIQFLGGVCRNCGGTFEDCCYDFHHVNPKEKDFTIGNVSTNGAKTWNKIRDELKKCVLLCANCHRLIHSGLIDINIQQYFNDEYYEWDLTEYDMVNTKNGTPRMANTICPECGQHKSADANLCFKCSKTKQLSFDVSREQLKEMIRVEPFTLIGDKYGVSDNAIRQRCKKLKLPYRKKDILTYSQEEWKKI